MKNESEKTWTSASCIFDNSLSKGPHPPPFSEEGSSCLAHNYTDNSSIAQKASGYRERTVPSILLMHVASISGQHSQLDSSPETSGFAKTEEEKGL